MSDLYFGELGEPIADVTVPAPDPMFGELGESATPQTAPATESMFGDLGPAQADNVQHPALDVTTTLTTRPPLISYGAPPIPSAQGYQQAQLEVQGRAEARKESALARGRAGVNVEPYQRGPEQTYSERNTIPEPNFWDMTPEEQAAYEAANKPALGAVRQAQVGAWQAAGPLVRSAAQPIAGLFLGQEEAQRRADLLERDAIENRPQGIVEKVAYGVGAASEQIPQLIATAIPVSRAIAAVPWLSKLAASSQVGKFVVDGISAATAFAAQSQIAKPSETTLSERVKAIPSDALTGFAFTALGPLSKLPKVGPALVPLTLLGYTQAEGELTGAPQEDRIANFLVLGLLHYGMQPSQIRELSRTLQSIGISEKAANSAILEAKTKITPDIAIQYQDTLRAKAAQLRQPTQAEFAAALPPGIERPATEPAAIRPDVRAYTMPERGTAADVAAYEARTKGGIAPTFSPPADAKKPTKLASVPGGEPITMTPLEKARQEVSEVVASMPADTKWQEARRNRTIGQIAIRNGVDPKQLKAETLWTTQRPPPEPPSPAVNKPQAAPPREAPAPQAVKSETAGEHIGDEVTIMQVPSVLADTKTIEGVRWDIFNGAKLKEKRATVRVVDSDSGEVLQLKQFPSYEAAEKYYKLETSKAAKAAGETIKRKKEVAVDYSDWKNKEQLNARSPASHRSIQRLFAAFKRAGIPIESKGAFGLGSKSQMLVIPNTIEARTLLKENGGSVAKTQWSHLATEKQSYSEPSSRPPASILAPEQKATTEPTKATMGSKWKAKAEETRGPELKPIPKMTKTELVAELAQSGITTIGITGKMAKNATSLALRMEVNRVRKANEKAIKVATPSNRDGKQTMSESRRAENPPTLAKGPGNGEGPGAAIKGESGAFSPVTENVTSIRNKQANMERKQLGYAPAEEVVRKSDSELFAQMERRLAADRDAGRKLATQLKDNPTAVTDIEHVLLLHEKVRLMNERNDAAEAMNTAKTPEEFQRAESQRNAIEKELEDFMDMAHAVGTATGRGLRARSLYMTEDYSLASMVTQLKADKGGVPLTEGEVNRLREIERKYNETLKAQNDYAKAKAEDAGSLESNAVFEKFVEDVMKRVNEPRKLSKRAMDFIDKQEAEALARLKARGIRMSAGVDPTIVADLAIIGGAKIARGVIRFSEWSTSMLKDFDETIQPYLREVYKKSFKKSNDMEVEGDPGFLGKKKRERAAKKPTELQEMVRALVKVEVEGGKRDLNEIIAKITPEVRQTHPDITERQVRDAFTDYGKPPKLAPTDPVKVAMAQLRTEGQLESKLDDLLKLVALEKQQGGMLTPQQIAELRPKHVGDQRVKQSDLAREKQRGINSIMRDLGIHLRTTDKPELQLKSALDAIKTRMANEIRDLEKALAPGGKRIFRPKRSVELDAKALEMKVRLEQLREQYAEMYPAEPMTDAKRLEIWKRNIQKRTQDLQERTARGEFEPKPRSEPPPFDEEAARLKTLNDDAKYQFARERFFAKEARATTGQKIWRYGVREPVNLLRSNVASVDVSAVGRQSLWFLVTHPISTGRLIVPSLKAMKESNFKMLEQRILSRPFAVWYRRSKLNLTTTDVTARGKMEEQFRSQWGEKLPWVRWSQRNYVAMLNQVRAIRFDAIATEMGLTPETMTQKEAVAIAKYVDAATGRGRAGSAEATVQGLANAFWSPRLILGRAQMLIGYPVFGSPRSLQYIIAKDYLKFIGGMLAVIYGSAAAINATSDTEATVEKDWRSSDFMKVKWGNTRIDWLGGFQQLIAFVGKLFTGSTKNASGKIITLRGDKAAYGKDLTMDMAKFVRTKLTPIVGTGVNIIVGKNVVGEKTTPWTVTRDLTVPLSMRDVYDNMVERGVPAGAALTILNMAGVGVNTYEAYKPKPRNGSMGIGNIGIGNIGITK